MTRYSVRHKTTYSYKDPVSLSHNHGYFEPRELPNQHAFSNYLVIDPEPAVLTRHRDYFGNRGTFFTVQERHKELLVLTRFEVDLEPTPLPDPGATMPWEEAVRALGRPRHMEAYQFSFESAYCRREEAVDRYARKSFTPGRPVLEAALELNHRIHHDFRFDAEATNVTTPVDEFFEKRRGVCQDFAHLLITSLRSLNLAARYVSGYILTQPPPGQPRLEGADASHAWVSLYCPDHGWVDLDPTNDMAPRDQHVTLAWGRDYEDVSPLRGVVLGGGKQSVSVGVDVLPGP